MHHARGDRSTPCGLLVCWLVLVRRGCLLARSIDHCSSPAVLRIETAGDPPTSLKTQSILNNLQ
eukprot:COSAG01_NODE_580_length_15231_cov_6.793220_11_plen_64_part_00